MYLESITRKRECIIEKRKGCTIMRLRRLQRNDARYMLEWMHDDSVARYFKKDFSHKTIDDCLDFIADAQDETESIHLAIVDYKNEYVGTVSLKHIQQNTAELGIVMRNCAKGKGYSLSAISELFKYGYINRGIDTVYWCVEPQNERAVRFYDNNNFHRCTVIDKAYGYTDTEKQKYIWYCEKIWPHLHW